MLIFGSIRFQSDGISKILETQYSFLDSIDPIYGMYPFLLAVCTPRASAWLLKEYSVNEHLETVYKLLREAPWVLEGFCKK